MRTLLPLLLGFLGLGEAHAETQELRYTLASNGQEVGHRDLKIRFLPGEYGEKRFIESWTEFKLPLARRSFHYKQRLNGLAKSGPMGFRASMSEDGHLREVQVVHQPEQWMVTHAELGRSWVLPVDSEAFDATSITLVDPGSHGFLNDRLSLRVLSAETGKVVEGRLVHQGSQSVAIAGQAVEAQHYLWELESGSIHLAYDSAGYLIRYTLQIAGQELTATLDALPAERSFEEDMPMMLFTEDIQEEAL
ncbi:MAG: DUF6134 family protein [Myxococcota bacterium]|nr:DUF6134 family protein [Myxococcota bacterium]